MRAPSPHEARERLEAALGHRFRRRELLGLALRHPSFAYERDGTRGYERLEFLGDAVLDLAVALLLYQAHPTWDEGQLTRTRAALVNTRALAERAEELELGACLELGRTELVSGGARKPTILAAALEAVVGALFLDGGLEPVLALARRLFAPALEAEALPVEPDPKTRLQELAHALHRGLPQYRVVADSGVENDARRFCVEVTLDAEPLGRGRGRTKRAAERAAAEAALARLEARHG